jgi:hypothetical protein
MISQLGIKCCPILDNFGKKGGGWLFMALPRKAPTPVLLLPAPDYLETTLTTHLALILCAYNAEE